MRVIPYSHIAVRDAPALLHRSSLDEHDAGAALRELAEVHEVPVGDVAVLGRVLAHRRDDDAISRFYVSDFNGFEKKAQSRNTPLPVLCVSNTRYASSACSSFQRCEKMRSRSMWLSSMKRAQSAMPIALKVQEPISVTCRRSRSGLTLSLTSPPSPTKQAVPQVVTLRTAASRAAGALLHSRVKSAPSPFVFSRMLFSTSSREASTTSAAPNSLARRSRSAFVSTAMTRRPIAAPRRVALRPTGPWPNTARVSPPETRILLNAEKAVPVPQATAAPSAKLSSSGRGTSVFAGTFMYSAWPPWAVT